MRESCWLALSAPHLASAYYDPGVQRWINRDPIQEVVGPNLYAFVYNAPEGLVDTFGHSTDNDCFTRCIQDNLHDAKTYCVATGTMLGGALGNIAGPGGRPVASWLARAWFNLFMRGVPVSVPEYLAGRALIGANAAAASRAAAVVGAFMAGYGAGVALQCANQCFGGPQHSGAPPIFYNAPPDITISAPINTSKL